MKAGSTIDDATTADAKIGKNWKIFAKIASNFGKIPIFVLTLWPCLHVVHCTLQMD
jgi:hypothetical protein